MPVMFKVSYGLMISIGVLRKKKSKKIECFIKRDRLL